MPFVSRLFFVQMTPVFFLVGPTATGKSEIAAVVAARCGAEIVSADAYQIYRGLDLLTAKPDAATLARAPHHLIGTVPLTKEMNAERFRRAAIDAISQIQREGKKAIVVGGSGLYVKALTHGLSPLPPPDPALREELDRLTLEELISRLTKLDPQAAETLDRKNKRRVSRALEVRLLTGEPRVARSEWTQPCPQNGIFLFRDRDDLYARIDRRVDALFKQGVVAEVAQAGELSATAERTLGLREIRELIAGTMSEQEAIASIQQATRRYAKRQLTWFRRQPNFEPLNLSLLNKQSSAVEVILQKAIRFFAEAND
jgi:tRNA dimethylallyltransferase